MGNITMSRVLLSILNVEAVGSLGVIITSVVMVIAALIVIFIWGTKLNKFRWSR